MTHEHQEASRTPAAEGPTPEASTASGRPGSEPDPGYRASDHLDGRRHGRSRRGRRSDERPQSSESSDPSDDGRRRRRSESRDERSESRHHHRSGRSRGRAQRGDVRAAVLVLLADEPMHGYQLMHAIAERTQGAWRPSPGAIYPTIAQLEDEDLVTVVADRGRKLVTLTETGRDYLGVNSESLGDPFTAITSQAGGRHDLRGSVDQIHTAARALGKSGSDAQIALAQEVLARARRELYLILAEAPVDPSAETPDSSTPG